MKYLAEQFCQITQYLMEQFRQITHYLVEQLRQISPYLAEHLIHENEYMTGTISAYLKEHLHVHVCRYVSMKACKEVSMLIGQKVWGKLAGVQSMQVYQYIS